MGLRMQPRNERLFTIDFYDNALVVTTAMEATLAWFGERL
jgi:hypothetical protein